MFGRSARALVGRGAKVAFFSAALLCLDAYVAGAAPGTATSPAEIDAWAQSVCNSMQGPKSRAPVMRLEPWSSKLPLATTTLRCSNYYPLELIGDKGCAYDVGMTIGGYLSPDAANAEIKQLTSRNFRVFGYALKKDGVNVWWLVAADACMANDRDIPASVPGRALKLLQNLQQYGFTVKSLA